NAPFEPPYTSRPMPERIHEIEEIRSKHLNLARNPVGPTKPFAGHPVESMKPFTEHPAEQMQSFSGKNAIENVSPEKIVFRGEFEKGLDGHLTLGYDANHEPLPVNYNEVTYSGPVKETDFAGNDWLKKITEIAKNRKSDIQFTRDKLDFDFRNLKKTLMIYDELSKKPAYEKHASLVAKNISSLLKNISKIYGDIIDPKKLPEVFRRYLK
ncbi:MAG: hypothetical protein ABSE68_02695, partial [Minisyncoccia bacterium]